jgi:AraC-like DNA-binding protein
LLAPNSRVVLGQGDVFFIPARTPHECLPIGKGAQDYTVLCWTPGTAEAARQGSLPLRLSDPELFGAVSRFFERANRSASDAELRSLLRLIQQRLIRHLKPTSSRRPSPRASSPALAAAARFIEANASAPLNLPTIASIAALSRFHFNRSFRRATGITPHRYLIQCRIRTALHRMARSSALADLALELGFSDQSHFTRTFRKLVGVSPKGFVSQ